MVSVFFCLYETDFFNGKRKKGKNKHSLLKMNIFLDAVLEELRPNALATSRLSNLN